MVRFPLQIESYRPLVRNNGRRTADNLKSLLIFVVLLTAGILLQSCSSSLNIVDKPISFSKERIELTEEYQKNHYGIDKDNITIVPKIIVLHWTAINSFQKSFDTFNQEKLEGSRPDLANAGQVNVAIQFLVDKDGEVYRLMPETEMARPILIDSCIFITSPTSVFRF